MASKQPQPHAGRSGPTGGRCPICKRPAEQAFRPFCSARCRDVDLSRWLGGGYAIAGGQADADEDGEDAAARATPPRPPGDEDEEA
jgi:hypothetical protein